MSRAPRVVRAAGVVPVRLRSGALQVALVHRPKYDDWSWPKGKLDRGEDFAAAAAREALEETGLRVRLRRRLPDVRYDLRGGQPKLVRYWVGEVAGGSGRLEHEVDDVVWLSPTLAGRRLTYEHDRELLDRVVALRRDGGLRAWQLLVVRHAHAVDREGWSGPDPRRPLSARGRADAQRRVAALLDAYAPVTLLSSPSTRCTQTLAPSAERAGATIVTKKGLSEEGYRADATKLDKHLGRLLEAGEAAALCTHGPLLPQLVSRLVERAGAGLDAGERRSLLRLREVPLDKGEVLACTMLGTGKAARLIGVERHRPRP